MNVAAVAPLLALLVWLTCSCKGDDRSVAANRGGGGQGVAGNGGAITGGSTGAAGTGGVVSSGGAGHGSGGAGSGGLGGAGGVTAPPDVLEPTADCKLPTISPVCESGFCRVEPGCFIMGAPRTEYGIGRRSDVQVQVTLTRAFLLGQTEVTRAMWQSVGWELPAQPPHPNGDYGSPCEGENCPVPNVSFFDAVSFANKYSEDRGLPPCYRVSGCTGEVGNLLACSRVELTAASAYACTGFRLPTEAEWEYAARAGTKTAFFNGDITAQPDDGCHTDANLDAIGWYCDNAGSRPHAVGGKLPNGWGLYDTSGNVFEWCNDLYDASGYGQGPLIDPQGTVTRGPDLTATGEYPVRIHRGGSYLLWPSAAKVNKRFSSPDTGYAPTIGFRLARTAPEQ